MPVPDVVRHGVSDTQIKSVAEKVTTILNKLLGGFLRHSGRILGAPVFRSRASCAALHGLAFLTLFVSLAAFANRVFTGKEVVLSAQVWFPFRSWAIG